jgi:hypothetical protein
MAAKVSMLCSKLDVDAKIVTAGPQERLGTSRGMSLSVIVAGLSLTVAIGGQNVSAPIGAMTTPRTIEVRDVEWSLASNHWGWRSTPTFLLVNCRVYARL